MESDEALVAYKCSAPYSRDDEITIAWNDPRIGIDWGVERPTLSARDQAGLAVDAVMDRLPRF